jgi:hypothetical protein
MPNREWRFLDGKKATAFRLYCGSRSMTRLHPSPRRSWGIGSWWRFAAPRLRATLDSLSLPVTNANNRRAEGLQV